MPTPAERQALLFIAAVAALGVGARGWQAWQRPEPDPSAQSALAEQLKRVDSAIAAGGTRASRRTAARVTRPSAGRAPGHPGSEPPETPRGSVDAPPPGRVDPDVADAEALDRLPGIGPALAQRIVEDRARHGPFGSLEALERVRGIGPALAARLRAHVTFSSPPRQTGTEDPRARRGDRP